MSRQLGRPGMSGAPGYAGVTQGARSRPLGGGGGVREREGGVGHSGSLAPPAETVLKVNWL